MKINRNTGEVVLKCSSLAMSSMHSKANHSAVQLSGVTITVQNASKIWWLGTVSAKGGATNAPQDAHSCQRLWELGLQFKIQVSKMVHQSVG